MKWEIKKLADCCVSITDGDHQPPPKAQKGIPFVTISNITTANQFDFTNTMYVSEEYYNHLDSKRKPQRGDILYSVVGSFGIPVYIKETIPFVFQRHIAVLRPNHTILPQFLYYTMLNRDFYLMADAAAIGAAQRTVSLSALRNMKIAVPPINIQEKIVYLLSAYDNLIENNQKQIKLLEEAAQRLHKEWFVDLRFPGYETTPVVDGVPEGWQKYHLKEVIDYEIGGGWGEELPTDRYDCAAYVIRGTDLFDITHGNTLGIPFRYHSRSNLLARMLADGDIVFEVSGGSKTEGVARTALIRSSMLALWEKPAICASFCKLIRPVETRYSQFIFDTLQYMRFSGKTTEYDKRSASSIVNYRWKDFLSKETIVFPSDKVLKKYNLIAESTYQMMICKSISIEKAREARDRLLPKLMSGEIEV